MSIFSNIAFSCFEDWIAQIVNKLRGEYSILVLLVLYLFYIFENEIDRFLKAITKKMLFQAIRSH